MDGPLVPHVPQFWDRELGTEVGGVAGAGKEGSLVRDGGRAWGGGGRAGEPDRPPYPPALTWARSPFCSRLGLPNCDKGGRDGREGATPRLRLAVCTRRWEWELFTPPVQHPTTAPPPPPTTVKAAFSFVPCFRHQSPSISHHYMAYKGRDVRVVVLAPALLAMRLVATRDIQRHRILLGISKLDLDISVWFDSGNVFFRQFFASFSVHEAHFALPVRFREAPL